MYGLGLPSGQYATSIYLFMLCDCSRAACKPQRSDKRSASKQIFAVCQCGEVGARVDAKRHFKNVE